MDILAPQYKLGRIVKPHDPRTLWLHKYRTALTPTLPPIPINPDGSFVAADWTPAIIADGGYTMLGNGPDPTNPPGVPDGCGNCACVGILNIFRTIIKNCGGTFEPSAAQAILLYQQIQAYCDYPVFDPAQTDADGNNPTDTGLELEDVLCYAKNVGVFGYKILAFAAVTPSNDKDWWYGVQMYGGLYVAAKLPNQLFAGDPTRPWVGNMGPANPANGHCFVSEQFGSIVSWSKIIQTDPIFRGGYMDKAFIIITDQWMEANGKSPSGYDIQTLIADASALSAA